jgi:hypothetical protein
MKTLTLNKEVHELLKENGYEYFLITKVQLSAAQHIYAVTVKAEKKIPSHTIHSCTGIDDPMIISFIYRKGLNCDIFVELPEEKVFHNMYLTS